MKYRTRPLAPILRSTFLATVVSLLAISPSARADEAAGATEPIPTRRFVRVPAPDGIQIRRYNKTRGASPTKKDRVVVHYHGTLADGTVFDSSVERGYPAGFPMTKVVPCWQVALPLLHVGEKARLTCPPETAYGFKGSPPKVPANATLTFEIELINIH